MNRTTSQRKRKDGPGELQAHQGHHYRSCLNPYGTPTHEHAYNREDQKDEKENLADPGCISCDSAEAEKSGDQGDHEEEDGPTRHNRLPVV
jgi:hypothetical protein